MPRAASSFWTASTDHSFLNNHETSFFKMLQIIHIDYDEPAAKDARRRIVSFFREHLGS
jgi:dienelactone hydrolase